MEHRGLYNQVDGFPEVVEAFKALPCGERYLPVYEAEGFLQAGASPLDTDILEAMALPEEDRHGVLAEIERRWRVNRRTIYRHRDELRSALIRASLSYLHAHLLFHGLKEHAENGTFQIPVDSFPETSGGGRMVIP